MIFSTRAISCTWKRTVSKDSKTRVTIGPNPTRRLRLRAITPARNSSRTRS